MYHAFYHYRIHCITETYYTCLCILCIALYNNITCTHGSRFLVLHLEKIDIIMLCTHTKSGGFYYLKIRQVFH